jgi:phage tail tube protein FII
MVPLIPVIHHQTEMKGNCTQIQMGTDKKGKHTSETQSVTQSQTNVTIQIDRKTPVK